MADPAQTPDPTTTDQPATQPQPKPSSNVIPISDRLAKMEEIRVAKEEAMMAQEEKEINTRDATLKEAFNKIQPVTMSPRPKAEDYQRNPFDAFFSLNSVFGLLASAATHAPWQAGVMSAAAAVNAAKQQDADAYKDALDTWKDNMDLQLKIHASQLGDWDRIEGMSKDDLTLRNQLRTQHYALYGDDVAKAFDAARLDIQLADLQLKRQETAANLQAKYWEMLPKAAAGGAWLDYLKAKKAGDVEGEARALQEVQSIQIGSAANPGERYGMPTPVRYKGADGKDHETEGVYDKSRGQWLTSSGRQPIQGTDIMALKPATAMQSTPELKLARGAALATGMPVAQAVPGWGQLSTQERSDAQQAALQLIMQEHKLPNTPDGWKQAGIEYAQRQIDYAAARAGATREASAVGQRVGAIQVSSNEARGAAELVTDAYSKLPRQDFRPFNQLATLVADQTNTPEQGAAYQADLSLATAYARALNPSGIPRESDIERFLKILDTEGSSQERHAAVVSQALKEIDMIMTKTGIARVDASRDIRNSGILTGGVTQPQPSRNVGGDNSGWKIERVQ